MTKFVCVTAIEFGKVEFPLKTGINIEEISFFRDLYRTNTENETMRFGEIFLKNGKRLQVIDRPEEILAQIYNVRPEPAKEEPEIELSAPSPGVKI
jgi:hypothetical protein